MFGVAEQISTVLDGPVVWDERQVGFYFFSILATIIAKGSTFFNHQNYYSNR
jgi:hypothetical protein